MHLDNIKIKVVIRLEVAVIILISSYGMLLI